MKNWCLVMVWIVFILDNVMFEKSTARPNPDGQNITVSSNKSKIRILSNPPRREFFGNEQQIVFPDEYTEDTPEVIPRLNGPPKCADSSLTFCENFESYPYKEVQQILEQNKVPKFFFGVDEPPNEIANRLGVDDTERFMCDSISRTIFPKIGTNKNDKWKLIVNQDDDEGFVQAVRIEICKKPNQPCNVIGDMPVGYSTSCKQKYIYRRLISLDDNGKPIPDTFKMPSACCCAYKVDYSFLSRMRKDDISQAKS